jgi:outer membrane lipoprotein SlyB
MKRIIFFKGENGMKFKALLVAGVLGLSTLVTACAPDISAGSYTTGQIGQAAQTSRGVITAATPINVQNDGTLGTVIGGVAGAVAGSAIGGGTRANVLGGVGGAVLGGAAGNYAEKKLTQQTGMQYTVKLRNGRYVTVTQGMNPPLGVGQRVLVIFSNPARVVAEVG